MNSAIFRSDAPYRTNTRNTAPTFNDDKDQKHGQTESLTKY